MDQMTNERIIDILNNSKQVARIAGSIVAATTAIMILKKYGVSDEQEQVRAAACEGVEPFTKALNRVILRLEAEAA